VNPELPLRDIHLPEAIGWWPPAPGWWILLAAIILLGLWLWRRYRAMQKQRAFRRSVERELDTIASAFRQHQDAHRLVQDLSVLLRRAAMSVAPRQQVAGEVGEPWLRHLDELANMQLFDTRTGRQLITAPYQPKADVDTQALLEICRQWLRQINHGWKDHAHV
jgi:uncharacterized membrane protein YccC